jgi:hypothetical protein
MDCRQAGPYIDPSIISRMVRCLRGLSPYRLPRAESWRQAGPLCAPSMSVCGGAMRLVGSACSLVPSATQHRRDRGAVARDPMSTTHPRCSRSLKALRPGYPETCERYNGLVLRDPNMTPTLTGRSCYSRIVHTLVASGILQLPHAQARFTLPQSLLRETPAA